MTKPLTYRGEPLTEERAAQLADETLAELAAMSPEEIKARQRPPGTLAARLGRPRLGAGESIQVRARLAPELAAELRVVEARTGRRRSDIVRQAIAEYLARQAG